MCKFYAHGCCAGSLQPVHGESPFSQYQCMWHESIVVHTAEVVFGLGFCFNIFPNT